MFRNSDATQFLNQIKSRNSVASEFLNFFFSMGREQLRVRPINLLMMELNPHISRYAKLMIVCQIFLHKLITVWIGHELPLHTEELKQTFLPKNCRF